MSAKNIFVNFHCNYCCELMNILSYVMCEVNDVQAHAK